MKKQSLYRPVWVIILGVGMIGTACTQQEIPEIGPGEVRLQPHFYTGAPDTRSIVNGTAGTVGTDKIGKVGLYVTRKDTHVAYPGVTGGYAEFTYDGTEWSGTVNLSDIVARIYAFSPCGNGLVTPASGADTHTIPATIDANQTFNGANQWECSVNDYLYGTTVGTIEETPAAIEASNREGNFSPAIHLHHALAQVVFRLQSASGRTVDNTYDFVKQITLKHTSSSPFRTGTGTMQLKDGVLGGSLAASQSLVFTPNPASSAVKCGANTKPEIVAYGLVAPLVSVPANSSLTLTILLGKPEAADNERELTVTVPTSPQWKKGKRYVYTLTLSDRAITVDATATITGWTSSNTSSDMNPDGF